MTAQEPRGRRARALGALLAQSVLVALIYWPTLRLAFVSDAWAYLERLRQGVWAFVATPIGYHWQPVACAWIALIRAVFGERPAVFQAVNLVQLTVIGWLTFQLGRRLLADCGAAFLGSMLVLGSAAFYEVSYWPLAGSMHLLAALLYVLAVNLAYDVPSGRLGRGGPWLLGATVLAAVFSHPAMVTSVAVCALTLLLVGRRGGRARPGTLLPLALVVFLFAAARIGFDPYFDAAPRPGFEPERLVWLVRSGLLPVFTLRGSIVVQERLLTLGIPTPSPALTWTFVLGWLAAATVAAGLVVRRARNDGVRVLVAFLAVHLASLTLASGLSPRQSVVPSVPAALLTAWALRAGAERLARRASTAAGVALTRALPAAVVALLIAGAQIDHRRALRVHTRVADASRSLVARLDAVAPRESFELTLINMPASVGEHGIRAFAFANGLGEMAHLTSSTVRKVHLWRMAVRGAPDHIVAEVPFLDLAGLRAQLSEPRRVVLLYEHDPVAVRALTLADLDELAAR